MLFELKIFPLNQCVQIQKKDYFFNYFQISYHRYHHRCYCCCFHLDCHLDCHLGYHLDCFHLLKINKFIIIYVSFPSKYYYNKEPIDSNSKYKYVLIKKGGLLNSSKPLSKRQLAASSSFLSQAKKASNTKSLSKPIAQS